MSESAGITLVCLDLAGTTVRDDGSIATAFAEALATMGIVSGTATGTVAQARVHALRGRRTADILREVLAEDQARAAHLAFERSYAAALDRSGVTPIPGAEAALDKLSGSGIHICVVTGFGHRTISRVLDALDWWKRVDLAVGAEDTPRGRPFPDPILTAALRCPVDDVRHIAVCADTHSALQAGHRAGASVVAGVLTGAHDRDDLLAAGATHILDSVADLPALLLTHAAPTRPRPQTPAP